MDLEDKIKSIIGECFGKLRETFEEEGLELDYEKQDYVEELILNELKIQSNEKE